MLPRVEQVLYQTRERIERGNTHAEGKIVSIFEPETEVIRKGKAGKPTEFGKMVKVQEAEGQIVTHYEVYDRRPNDANLLLPALQVHQQQFGRMPHLVTADAGFFSARNEAKARELGVKRVAIPGHGTRSEARKQHRSNGGSETRRSGASAAKGASACSSAATAWTAAATRAPMACAVGRARRHRRQPHQHRPRLGPDPVVK